MIDKAKPNPAAPSGLDAVARGYRKIMDGNQSGLTNEERTALKRHEKEKEERIRWQYYNSIPQKHWRQMSGRQTKVINEQALRYEIPFGGATINLPAVVRSLHDFLAENKHKLSRDDDDLMNGAATPALERYREERAAMARLDRLEREGKLVSRDTIRQSLAQAAALIRGAGESLQRQFGEGAADVLNEALEDAEREIIRFFESDHESTGW
jgi:Fe-S cluster biosynthesis and repair protein YggX